MSNAAVAEEAVSGGTGVCTVDERGVYKGGEPIAGNTVTKSVLAFVAAVEATENLKIVGTDDSTDDFILEDMNVSGEHITVKLNEIVERVVDSAKATKEECAANLVKVISGDKDAVSLYTITRVVGYNAKVSNFNRSKKAELIDRSKGQYSTYSGSAKACAGKKDRTMGDMGIFA